MLEIRENVGVILQLLLQDETKKLKLEEVFWWKGPSFLSKEKKCGRDQS